MKYLSTASFAICFLIFMLFTENFVISMNQKLIFWDYASTIISRELFMKTLGWGVALIFCIFVSFTLMFAVLLAFKLAKPKLVIQVNLDSIASAHLLLIIAVLMVCFCGNPVFQIVTNVYILNGLASFLFWFFVPVAIAVPVLTLFVCSYAIKSISKAFKSK